MTMYLPNPDVRPTGYEPAEFIDVPPMDESRRSTRGPAERLDPQTRLNIVRWAEEYISGVVEDHNGDPEDVRAIIHDLHDHITLPAPDTSP